MGQPVTDNRFGYRPALDGLRAVAVAAVVVYHGYANTPGHPQGSGGFLGVDIFFVLSGYLITSLLVLERARNSRIDLRRFWYRRAKRLLPAVGVALLLVAVYGAITPAHRTGLQSDSIFTLLYIQNWHEVWTHTTTQFTPLSHMWSLSIEEQWYLVWPLALVAAMHSFVGRRRGVLVAVVAGLAVASAVEMAMLYRSFDIARVYYGTDTRAQALLIGAAFALLPNSDRPLRSGAARYTMEATGWLALTFLGFAILRAQGTDEFLYHGGFLLVAIATGLVITAAVRAESALRTTLAIKPLVLLGLVSYGLYLYHRILFAFLLPGRVGVTGVPLFVVRVVVSVAVAGVSYRFLERPIRDGSLTVKRPRLVLPVAIVSVVALVLVTTTSTEHTVPSTSVAPSTRAWLEQQRASTPPHTRRVFVVGEAQAFELQLHLGDTFTGLGIRGVAYGLSDCGIGVGDIVVGLRLPTPAGCGNWPQTFRSIADAYRPDIVALYVGDTELFDRVAGNRLLKVGSPKWTAMFERALDTARTQLTHTGARLVVLTSPCANSRDLTAAFGAIQRDRTRIDAVNRVIRAYATTSRGEVQFADLAALLCPNGKPLRDLDGKTISTPTSGLTDDGAKLVWKWIAAHTNTQ